MQIIRHYDVSKNNVEKKPISLSTLAAWAKYKFGCKPPSLASLSGILTKHKANIFRLHDETRNETGKQRKRRQRASKESQAIVGVFSISLSLGPLATLTNAIVASAVVVVAAAAISPSSESESTTSEASASATISDTILASSSP
jgi:hypothetical protein